MDMLCDLGTSNFRAAMVGSDMIICEPCVVAVDKTNAVIVGSKAYEMVGRHPSLIDIVKPVEGGVIRNVEAAAEILKHCVKTLTGRANRRFSLLVSVPSQFTSVESKALEDAARSAGARTINYVNAGVAAAIGSSLPVDGPNGCLVVNLGGGRTEVSLISMNGVVASESIRTGGQAIDERSIGRVRSENFFEIGQRSAELLKHRLSDGGDMNSVDVRGRNLKNGLPGSLSLPRDIVDKIVAEYCDVIVDLIRQVISECPPELAGDIIERGILLFGGGANIQGLVRQLQARIEPLMVVSDDPEMAVIRGLCKSQEVNKRRLGFSAKLKIFQSKSVESINT